MHSPFFKIAQRCVWYTALGIGFLALGGCAETHHATMDEVLPSRQDQTPKVDPFYAPNNGNLGATVIENPGQSVPPIAPSSP